MINQAQQDIANGTHDHPPSHDTESGTDRKAIYREIKVGLEHLIAGRYSQIACTDPDCFAILKHIAADMQAADTRALVQAINLSVNINDAVVAGAEMTREAREISQSSETIASAVQELTASVENIAADTNNVADQASEMDSIAQRGLATTVTANNTMKGISSVTTDASDKIATLMEAAQEITGVLKFINDIAKQTNLLALNATIEAARAGEAGKGFAVVAGEVKQLATKTNESTQEIEEKIKFLLSEAEALNGMMEKVPATVGDARTALKQSTEDMQHLADIVQDITGRTRNVADILSEQKDASNEAAQNVIKVSTTATANLEKVSITLDAMDTAEQNVVEQVSHFVHREIPNLTLYLAKSDHIIWKKRLAAMLVGRESLNPDELSSHHTCRLGQWYYALKADSPYVQHPAFKALEVPHERVHRHGIEAATFYRDGNLDVAIESVRKAGESSTDVLNGLDDLIAAFS